MRSTQAVPRSLGGAPARSTARPHPHPHQACGIQTEACTQGQRSCLLCHMPSEGRLTNKSQPARSKQVQPAQPARHKTSPQHSKCKSKSNCWRPCAPRQFLFKGRKVLVSFFWKNHSTKMNSSSLSSSHECHRCLASYSQIPNTWLKRICFKPSIADDKLFLVDLCWLLYGIFLSPFEHPEMPWSTLCLVWGPDWNHATSYAMLCLSWTHPNWSIELPMAQKHQAHRANCRNVQAIQDGSWRTKSRLRGTTLLQDRCVRNQPNLTIVDAKGIWLQRDLWENSPSTDVPWVVVVKLLFISHFELIELQLHYLYSWEFRAPVTYSGNLAMQRSSVSFDTLRKIQVPWNTKMMSQFLTNMPVSI